MIFRHALWLGLGSLLLLAGAAPAAAPAARLHWLGLDQIRADTNAAPFLAVWQLPQTQTLLAQTLAKISRLPQAGATNAASALLRPLLDDLISAETHLELYAPPGSSLITRHSSLFNAPPSSSLITRHSSLLLALRLPADRARLWQTNLPAAFPHATFARAGAWTLVALGADANADALAKFAARLAAADPQFLSLAPRHSSLSTPWLTADLSQLPTTPSTFNFQLPPDASNSKLKTQNSKLAPAQLPTANCQLPSPISHLHLTLTGENGRLLTRATADFSHPLNLTLPPWEIPTNYIHQFLTSFTAVRGLAPWLATTPAWQKTHLTPPPDQAFVWAQEGTPFQTYFALPLPAATNQLTALVGPLLTAGNVWLATNAQGTFEWQTNLATLLWNDALVIAPTLKPVRVNQHDYLLGALYPFTPGDTSPPPADILRPVLSTPDLVYYSAEMTGQRIEDGFFILQLFRVVFRQAQLPAAASATLWLKKVEPLLGPATTVVTQTGPAQLTLSRVSTLGLTALELHLLADWLESPTFPRGLHTFSKAAE
jgi:hypothetical protein